MNIPNLDNLEVGEFDYLKWFDLQLQLCFNERDIDALEDEYRDQVWQDENIRLLFTERREAVYNPLHKLQCGATAKLGEINKAVEMAVKRDNT